LIVLTILPFLQAWANIDLSLMSVESLNDLMNINLIHCMLFLEAGIDDGVDYQ
jgi:hypothetical protein